MTGNDPLHDDVRMLAVHWTPLDHLAAAAGPHGRSGRSLPIRRETEVRPTATCG